MPLIQHDLNMVSEQWGQNEKLNQVRESDTKRASEKTMTTSQQKNTDL